MKQLTVLRVLLLAELNFKINFKKLLFSGGCIFMFVVYFAERSWHISQL